jgi:hypothetical protein
MKKRTVRNENGVLRWVFVFVIVLCFVWNYSGMFDPKPDLNGDNLIYYTLALSLSRGEGYVSPIGPVPEPHTHFPPGYPAFMSLFLRLFPDNIVAMKVLNGILFLTALLLLFHILRKTGGKFGLYVAFSACLLCTFHPELLRYATIMMSEMLYTCITLGIITIYLHLDMEKLRHGEWRQICLLIGLCLLTAASYLVRSIGMTIALAVVAAFGLSVLEKSLGRKGESHSWLWPLLVCALVLFSLLTAKESWSFRNRQVNPEYKGSYTNNFMSKQPDGQEKMSGLADWSERLAKNFTYFTTFYIPQSIFDPDKAVMGLKDEGSKTKPVAWGVGVIVLTLILAGAFTWKKIRWLAVSYFVITVGVLMLYPEWLADIRYLIPLVPLLIGGFLSGVVWLASLLAGRSPKRWIAYGLPLTLLVLLIGVTAPKYRSGQNQLYRRMASYKSFKEFPEGSSFRQFVEACEAFSNAPEDILVATRKPEIFYFFSHYHHAVPVSDSPPDEIIELLSRNNVDYLIGDSTFLNTYYAIVLTSDVYPEHFRLIKLFSGSKTPAFILAFIASPGAQ